MAAQPRIFKVVDVSNGAVLADGTDTRATIDTLTAVATIFDVEVYVWHPPAMGWRQLTLGELRTLWDFRGR